VSAAAGQVRRAFGEAVLALTCLAQVPRRILRRFLAQAFERLLGPGQRLLELALGLAELLPIEPVCCAPQVIGEPVCLLEHFLGAAAVVDGIVQRQPFQVLRHSAHVLAGERCRAPRGPLLRAGER
jgi:hypothetical protein